MNEPRLTHKTGEDWTYVIDEAAGTVEFFSPDAFLFGPRTFEEFAETYAAVWDDVVRDKNFPEYQLMVRVCRDELIDRGLIRD